MGARPFSGVPRVLPCAESSGTRAERQPPARVSARLRIEAKSSVDRGGWARALRRGPDSWTFRTPPAHPQPTSRLRIGPVSPPADSPRRWYESTRGSPQRDLRKSPGPEGACRQEQLIRDQQVGGSSPPVGSNDFKHLRACPPVPVSAGKHMGSSGIGFGGQNALANPHLVVTVRVARLRARLSRLRFPRNTGLVLAQPAGNAGKKVHARAPAPGAFYAKRPRADSGFTGNGRIGERGSLASRRPGASYVAGGSPTPKQNLRLCAARVGSPSREPRRRRSAVRAQRRGHGSRRRATVS